MSLCVLFCVRCVCVSAHVYLSLSVCVCVEYVTEREREREEHLCRVCVQIMEMLDEGYGFEREDTQAWIRSKLPADLVRGTY